MTNGNIVPVPDFPYFWMTALLKQQHLAPSLDRSRTLLPYAEVRHRLQPQGKAIREDAIAPPVNVMLIRAVVPGRRARGLARN